MSYNRRQFLKTGGVFASALAMGSTTDLFAAYKPLKAIRTTTVYAA